MTIDKKDYLLGKAVGILELASVKLKQEGAHVTAIVVTSLAKEIKKELGME